MRQCDFKSAARWAYYPFQNWLALRPSAALDFVSILVWPESIQNVYPPVGFPGQRNWMADVLPKAPIKKLFLLPSPSGKKQEGVGRENRHIALHQQGASIPRDALWLLGC